MSLFFHRLLEILFKALRYFQCPILVACIAVHTQPLFLVTVICLYYILKLLMKASECVRTYAVPPNIFQIVSRRWFFVLLVSLFLMRVQVELGKKPHAPWSVVWQNSPVTPSALTGRALPLLWWGCLSDALIATEIYGDFSTFNKPTTPLDTFGKMSTSGAKRRIGTSHIRQNVELKLGVFYFPMFKIKQNHLTNPVYRFAVR